ncbi:MAG: MerR family transcriptional regulator, partial [Eubacterium sp.]
MKTVKEISRLTGVSVRTLHYYDEIDLLKPTQITDAGYRLYDDTALERLHSILLFRELQFPLKEIKAILDSPDFDTKTALNEQIELLELQKKRLDKIISS